MTIKVMMPVWNYTDECFFDGTMVSSDGNETLVAMLKLVTATAKGFAEGAWSGLKSDVEGIVQMAEDFHKLITNPAEMARSLKESFKALLGLTLNQWLEIPKTLFNSFLEKAEKSIPWESPTAGDILAYLVGFSGGYVVQQISMTLIAGAAAAGRFGTQIATIIRKIRTTTNAAQNLVFNLGGDAVAAVSRKAKGAMFRWQSQYVSDVHGMRALRKIQDYSFRDYVPVCPKVFGPPKN